MVTKAGPTTGKTSSKTSAARKRAPAKPVIIDVEAGEVASAPKKPAATASVSKSSGLDDATARAAGLSAADSALQTAPEGTGNDAADENAKEKPETDSTLTGNGSSDAAGTPRAFVLAAAGFIGALAALALMFLAQLLGLVSVPNGQLDVQRSALLALEQRAETRFAALEAVQPSAAQTDLTDLGPLEAELADLRDEIVQMVAITFDDAAPVDFDALLIEVLTPLEERIGAIEAVIQFPGPLSDDPLEDFIESAPAADLQELVELRDLIGSASGDIAVLRSDLGLLRSDFQTLSTVEDPDVGQVSALDERVNQMSSDMADRLAALSVRVADLGDGMAVMGEQLTAFEEAPIAVAPDQLARLGLALDGLAAARDSGAGLAGALAAAQAASAFDAELSGALAPLAGLSLDAGLDDAGLDDAGLLVRYESAAGAMLAAAPGSTREGGGLLDALGERARQMVTIRAPGDALNDVPGTVTGQIDQLGSLVASRQYEPALAVFDSLPDGVKAAGSDVLAALSARVTLDNSLIQARSGLLAALASSNQ